MNLRFHASSVFLFFIFFDFNVYADINVSPKIVTIDKTIQYVNVTNEGEHTEYLNIVLYRIENPGADVNDEILLNIGDIMKPSIIATPFKMTLAPSQSKIIKISSLKMVKKETLYRLAITPVLEYSKDYESRNFFIINIGYNLLIRNVPTELKPSWEFSCNENKVVMHSTGNSRVEYVGISDDGKSEYEFNLYPGDLREINANNIHAMINNEEVNFKC